jgi:hypothetical protein
MTDKYIRTTLKLAAFVLNYPARGIPVDHINTHSLRSGGANALALNGYSEWEIQKMGRWRSTTFKEYIQNELHCYAIGMSSNMQCQFNFVNIAGGTYHDVTDHVLDEPYNIHPSTEPTFQTEILAV